MKTRLRPTTRTEQNGSGRSVVTPHSSFIKSKVHFVGICWTLLKRKYFATLGTKYFADICVDVDVLDSQLGDGIDGQNSGEKLVRYHIFHLSRVRSTSHAVYLPSILPDRNPSPCQYLVELQGARVEFFEPWTMMLQRYSHFLLSTSYFQDLHSRSLQRLASLP